MNSDHQIAQVKSARIAQAGQEVSDLCNLICSETLGRLKLAASRNSLFQEGVDAAYNEHNLSLRAPSVPLARILGSSDLQQDLRRRLLLSYLLAKAVWQFYDTDWMDCSWTKDTVHFMRQRLDRLQKRGSVDHRPFIVAEFSPSAAAVTTAIDPMRQTHIYPKILALGLMLLEIELGESLEKHCPTEHLLDNGQQRPNASHIAAGRFIRSQEWKDQTRTLMPVKQAIERCLGPDTAVLGTDPSCVRDNLYKCVVAKLERLFEMMWGQSPGETTHPGPITFDGHGTFFGEVSDTPEPEPTLPATPQAASPRHTNHAALLASSSAVRSVFSHTRTHH
jgi:hypothetical protein